MNELLIERLRAARLNKNMKQQEVADILGIKPNTLSNWEKGRTEPDIDTFVKLCDIYEIDCASLLEDVYAFKRVRSDISLEEYEFLKKLRALDEHGKKNVNNILENEYSRCNAPAAKGQLSLFDLVSSWENSNTKGYTKISEGEAPAELAEVIELFKKTTGAIAAHNDHESEPGEQEKMQEDIANLKRPE